MPPSGFHMLCVCGELLCEYFDVCVPQVRLYVHVCVQPMAEYGPQSNLPLWSLLDRWRPLLLPTFPSGPGSGASISLECSPAATAESGDNTFALGSEGQAGVLGPSHPHASQRSDSLPLVKPILNPGSSVPRFGPKEIWPRPQCVVWCRVWNVCLHVLSFDCLCKNKTDWNVSFKF